MLSALPWPCCRYPPSPGLICQRTPCIGSPGLELLCGAVRLDPAAGASEPCWLSTAAACSPQELRTSLLLCGLREPHMEVLHEQSLGQLLSMELSSVGADPGPHTPPSEHWEVDAPHLTCGHHAPSVSCFTCVCHSAGSLLTSPVTSSSPGKRIPANFRQSKAAVDSCDSAAKKRAPNPHQSRVWDAFVAQHGTEPNFGRKSTKGCPVELFLVLGGGAPAPPGAAALARPRRARLPPRTRDASVHRWASERASKGLVGTHPLPQSVDY